MSLESNKEAVREYFASLQSTDPAARLADSTWRQFIPGELPIAGMWTKDEYLAMMRDILADTGVEACSFHIGTMTAEENRVAVEAEAFCNLPDGRQYHNWYHYLFQIEDGQITLVKEYMDMLHIFRMFRGPWIEGPPKERLSNLF
jgi:ketosteroid isomerase-like protein